MPTRDRSTDPAVLRRIAIVIGSLPPSTASRLMQSLPASIGRDVRRSVETLDDVDPLERRRALQSFAGGVRRAAESPTITMDRVAVPPANTLSAETPPSQAPDPPPEPAVDGPFEFLETVPAESLTQLLSVETPQTVATVLAHLRPATAAAVLPNLPSTLQSAAMTRLSQQREVPEETLTTLADHFRTAVRHTPTPAQQSSQTLRAILAAMPHRSLSATDKPTEQSAKPDSIPTQTTTPQPTTPPPQPALSTDAAHQILITLPSTALCQALGTVPTETAVLALCGLPTNIVTAALAHLPKPAAATVRRQMMQVHSINLRDIDRAKCDVARAAGPAAPLEMAA